MLLATSYYDGKGQLIRSKAQHYKGGSSTGNYDEVTNTYSFTGQLLTSARRHYLNNTESLYTLNTYTYDHLGRKVDTYQKTGNTNTTVNTPVLLARNVYNEVGQLKTRSYHSTNSGSSFAQNVNYLYNERGWLQSQGATALSFSQTLKYTAAIAGTTPQYNGNISRQEWTNSTGSKYYNYRYNKLNRLSDASGLNNTEALGYDPNGNITRLQRKENAFLIDQLRYVYAANSNKLTSVVDTNASTNAQFQLTGTTGYTYDLNGNMVKRINSNAANNQNDLGTASTQITYNVLNLPVSVPTTTTSGTLTYTYDATGNKLRMAGSTMNFDYISGIHYNGGSFDFANTETGRVIKNGTGSDPAYKYEYTVTDHLGNGRLYFDVNGSGVAQRLQEFDYYAFGKSVTVGIVSGTSNRYQYNGKEKQEEMDMYDFGARFYDPVIGRWSGVDPLAEIYHSNSSYHYASNNPLRYIDPNGKEIIGINEDDIKKFLEDLRKVFADKKFDKFNALVTRTGKKGDGLKLNKIDAGALASALEGLEGDDLALASIVGRAINSKDVHTVEYAEMTDVLSSKAKEGVDEVLNGLFKSKGIDPPDYPAKRTADQVASMGTSGMNFPRNKGSHSVILEGAGVINSGGRRELDAFHEVFGHGIPSAAGASKEANNTNAIRTENLVRRVLGIKEQRDGSDHNGGAVKNPSALPSNK